MIYVNYVLNHVSIFLESKDDHASFDVLNCNNYKMFTNFNGFVYFERNGLFFPHRVFNISQQKWLQLG